MEHLSPIICLSLPPKSPSPTKKEKVENLSSEFPQQFILFPFLIVLVCYKPWLFIYAFQMLKHMCVFVYILLKEISMRSSISIINWIFNMSTETYLFSRKSMFCVIYSNCSKLKGPTKKNIFNYEKWKGYIYSK